MPVYLSCQTIHTAIEALFDPLSVPVFAVAQVGLLPLERFQVPGHPYNLSPLTNPVSYG